MKVLVIFVILAVGLVSADIERDAFDIGFNDCVSSLKAADSPPDLTAIIERYKANPFAALNLPPGSFPPENIQVQFLLGFQSCFSKNEYAYNSLNPKILPELPIAPIGRDDGNPRTQLAVARRTGFSDSNTYFTDGSKSLDGFKTVLNFFVTKPFGPYGTVVAPSQTLLSRLQNEYQIGYVESVVKHVRAYDLVFNNNFG